MSSPCLLTEGLLQPADQCETNNLHPKSEGTPIFRAPGPAPAQPDLRPSSPSFHHYLSSGNHGAHSCHRPSATQSSLPFPPSRSPLPPPALLLTPPGSPNRPPFGQSQLSAPAPAPAQLGVVEKHTPPRQPPHFKSITRIPSWSLMLPNITVILSPPVACPSLYSMGQ